jgi:propionyl-CoA carboxylase beta chain
VGPGRTVAEHDRAGESEVPYDIKDVIHAVADENYFFEVHEHLREEPCRSDSRGWMDVPSGSWRISRRILPDVWTSPRHQGRALRAFCDAFNIPLITFEDVPGFLPGTNQEFGGIIKHGAKLLFAFAERPCLKFTVITRRHTAAPIASWQASTFAPM